MTATGAQGQPASPVRELLGDSNFRNFWISQVLAFGINGTVRFMFVWLMVTLTDWSAAEGLIGVAFGVPALVLSLPGGAWSDRFDRRRFSLLWMAASAIAFASFAAAITLDLATPRLAGAAAVVVGSTLVIMQPNLNAIVPLLVPKERLMNAAALQNGGGQAAGFLGLAVGGGAIAVLGNAAGFGLLAIVMTMAFVLMARVTIPQPESGTETRKLSEEIGAGLRYGLGSEPRRSLLLATLILGSSFSVMQIAMPRVVEADFGTHTATTAHRARDDGSGDGHHDARLFWRTALRCTHPSSSCTCDRASPHDALCRSCHNVHHDSVAVQTNHSIEVGVSDG